MSLQYIIDGYNILNHPQFSRQCTKKIYRRLNYPINNIKNAYGEGKTDSRVSLLGFIKINKLCGSPRNKITVVFDGYSDFLESINYADIDVVFSRKETADERIKKMVESSGNPKNIVVVSDDKEIVFFIKSLGARPMSVEEFIGSSSASKGQGHFGDDIQEKKGSLLKSELTYSQIQEINKELKNIWLK